MAIAAQPALLGCGRPIDDVWETMDAPVSAHERHCPDCRAARSSLEPLFTATHELRIRDNNDADLKPRASVKASIMDIARAEVRRGRQLPLHQPSADQLGSDLTGPDLTISEQAVTSVIRAVGDTTVNDVRARRCSVELDDTDAGNQLDSASQPARLRIHLTVSVLATLLIPEAVDALRQSIIDHVAQELGLVATRVDITVEDIHHVS